MDALITALIYPLLILLIGAAISGWLIPRLTQQWQDERKALELKAELVERVSRAVTEIAAATQFAIVGAQSQTQSDFDKAYASWMLDKAVLTSLLPAYFRAGNVSDRWTRSRALATAYYVQSGISRTEARNAYLSAVSAGLALEPPEDCSESGRVPTQEELDGKQGGGDISDVNVLRSELDRALVQCVKAIVDDPVRLTGSSSRQGGGS